MRPVRAALRLAFAFWLGAAQIAFPQQEEAPDGDTLEEDAPLGVEQFGQPEIIGPKFDRAPFVAPRFGDEDLRNAPPSTSVPHTIARLRGLDKFSGVVTQFEAPVGGETRYRRLKIRVFACRAEPDDKAPDAYAYLQVDDSSAADNPAFAGWMFSSSPALSALDHPRFDVWVTGCAD